MTATVAELVAAIKSEGVSLTISDIDKVGDTGENTEKRLRNSNKNSGKSFKQLAVQAAGVGGAIYAIKKSIDFLGESIDVTRQFNASISDLSAITGAVGADLEYLKQKSIEFGASTTLSATQASQAFKLIASAKPDLLENAAALSKVTKEAITLAAASGTDLPAAAKTLGSALNQFNAGAEESGRFINVLAAGAKYGASEIVDTAEALRDSGTVASSAGVSFEELNANIQSLASVSIKGSRAGVGLRNIILRLQNQTEKGFNPAIVGLNQAMLNLQKANLDTTQLTKLFGLEMASTADALIKQAGTLDTLTDKITGTGTAYEQARVKVDNLDGDLKQLNSAYETLQITVGTKLDPALRELTKLSTDFIKVITDLINENESMNDNLATTEVVLTKIGDVAYYKEKTKASAENIISEIEDVIKETGATRVVKKVNDILSF